MDIQKVMDNLKRKGFKPFYFETGNKATDFVLDLIPQNATVGIGGSMTVKELGLDQKLVDKGAQVYAHAFLPPDKQKDLFKLANSSEWYISSTNALTEGGDFVNIDGSANRISALAFGIPNVVYVLGVNKITHDLESAIDRVRNYASPLNVKRLNKNTPCATSGQCCYCDSPDCICNATLISHHPTKHQKNVYAVIIGETLGY